VAYIEFNGTGSTKEDWFSKAKILEASWSDLVSHQRLQYFSIAGYGVKLLVCR